MRKIIKIFLLLSAVNLNLFQTIVAQEDSKIKTIVVFFAFNANTPAYEKFLEGFRSQMQRSYNKPYNLLTEYLNLNRFPEEEIMEQYISLYNDKMENMDIGLIVTVAPDCYQMLKKYGLKALNTSPVVAVEFPESLKSYNPDSKTKFIELNYDFGKTLKSAFDLFPENKDVYIFAGSSKTDAYFTELIRNSAVSFTKNHRFTFYTDLTIDSSLSLVQTVPRDALIFVSTYFEDKNKTQVNTSMAVSYISEKAKAPLFTFTDNFIKRGGIGGNIYSYYNLGVETMKVAGKILDNVKMEDIIVDTSGLYVNLYDWSELVKWDIQDSEKIPANRIFVNKEINFFSSYRYYIAGFSILFTILIFLLLRLIRLNRYQKNIVRQKEETEALYRLLVREDRILHMSELTAALSHELNQPLTAILFNVQAGLRFLKSGKLDAKLSEEILQNVVEDTNRAGDLISSIRSFMKLEKREKEKLNLTEVVRESIRLLRTETISKFIKVKLNPLDKKYMVYGDRIQLQQLFFNLMHNSAQAMNHKPYAERMIEITQYFKKGHIFTSVIDNGKGIDKMVIDKLFRPFVTDKKDGLGIGLSICKSIIENHNGEIHAQNHITGGAEFIIKLPVAENE